jgi:membrane protein DedA with SNARE-associated domain
MNGTLQFVVRHGYLVVLVWVFAVQLGLPLPSIPLLLAAGALAGIGRMNFFATAAIAVLAALMSDVLWYQLGRHKGAKVLHFLCRVSLEPASCVRNTESIFARHGAKSLLVAKFIPGLTTAAPPLAGIFQMRFRRFLLFDASGATLWACTFLGLGYAFSGELERIADHAVKLGGGLLFLLVAVLGAYILWKIVYRRRFLRELRIARITAEELKKKVDAGEDIVIVDLRHSLELEADPEGIPGALHLDAGNLEKYDAQIPRGRDVVLYCT